MIEASINSSFKDFENKEHKVTLVAIVQNLPKLDSQNETMYHEVNTYSEYEGDEYVDTVDKCVKIGIAICNPSDTYSKEVGLLKAKSKIQKAKSVIAWLPNNFNFSTKVLKEILFQQLEEIKNNPGKFIKGYDDRKLRFEKKQKLENLKEQLSNSEIDCINILKSSKNIKELIYLATRKDNKLKENLSKALNISDKEINNLWKNKKK